MNMTKATGTLPWLRIYHLYRSAFPRSERKPFTMIRKMTKAEKTDTWYITDQGRFVGLAITINGPDRILLDYFAITEECRNGGYGSQILKALISHYEPKSLFGEIENVIDEGDDLPLRKRRKQFYLRNGLKEMEIMVYLFGVKMELIGTGTPLSFEEYRSFYAENYSQWAAEHISPAVYEREHTE